MHATSTPEVPSTYIHPFPSPESPKNILLLIRERITKNIFVFPLWNKCSSYLVTTTCYIISRDECSEKKRYEEIKRTKCSEPRKKRKSETRGKNGQVSDSRIRGTRYPPERKEKEEHLILLISFKKQGRYVSPQRANVELDFHHCYHHHHDTSFIRHTCTSWFGLLICFFGSMVWLYNKCLVSMYILSTIYELQI